MGLDLLWSILELLLCLAAIAVVIYLSFIATRYFAGKVNNMSKTNNIKILERTSLTQDKGLAIVAIGHQFFLVGYSTNTIEILQELKENDLNLSSAAGKPNFMQILNSQIKSRLDLKISGKDKQKTAPDGDAEPHPEEKDEPR